MIKLKLKLRKLTLLRGCFSHLLNCTNATKSRNASQILTLSFIIMKNSRTYFQNLVVSSVLKSSDSISTHETGTRNKKILKGLEAITVTLMYQIFFQTSAFSNKGYLISSLVNWDIRHKFFHELLHCLHKCFPFGAILKMNMKYLHKFHFIISFISRTMKRMPTGSIEHEYPLQLIYVLNIKVTWKQKPPKT